MNVLAITNLFPNRCEPRRGVFNLQQFTALSKRVNVTVVAPIPTFPGMGLFSGRVGDIDDEETADGLTVYHPRYLSIPKIGRRFHGRAYYRGIRARIKHLNGNGRFDTMLATWAYPDGYACYLMARELDIPLVVKVHGTDINEYLDVAWRRKLILEALAGADKVIAVSDALKRKMSNHGIAPERIEVLYNGVDTQRFQPIERRAALDKLGLAHDVRRVLFVGNLKPVKGAQTLLEAVDLLAKDRGDIHVHIIGFGPQETALKTRARDRGFADRVHFEGEKSHESLVLWFGGCDVLCIPSRSEGVPNVMLEAFACGLPVVASRVGGIPEILSDDGLGILVESSDPRALANALVKALGTRWDRRALRQRAEEFSWERNAGRLETLLSGLAR